MKKFFLLLFGFSLGITLFAQGPLTVKLWETNPNGTDSEKVKIQYFLPAKGNGSSVIICPGGGYGALCASYEGTSVAKWLNRYGIAGIVLYYRTAPNRHPKPLNDAIRAMRFVRANAAQYGLDPNRIGIMGFSAGGHVASTLATHFDQGNTASSDPVERVSSRPNFQILIYPVITMGKKTHFGSRGNLLGNRPSPELIKLLSNELQVTSGTPPAFVCHSNKDRVVPVENSRMYVEALKKNSIPVTYLELDRGDHGLGCGIGREWDAWQTACLRWLRGNGYADPK